MGVIGLKSLIVEIKDKILKISNKKMKTEMKQRGN
jgi:hypothetical protein